MIRYSISSLALCLLLAAGCSRGALTEKQARAFAEQSFFRVCRSYHLQPADYTGPISTEVGGAAFAYEWRPKAKGEGVLISITPDGGDEVAFLPTTP
jgi:hypothetical protein